MTDFKPMLACKAKPDKLKFPLFVQAKLDGIRCSIVNGRALSRTLKEIPNREIFRALSRPEFEGLDGELIVGDPTAKDAYRQTCSYVMAADKTGGDWTFHVFDRWNSPASFEQRYESLGCVTAEPRCAVVHWVRALDADHLERIEAALIHAGHEGVILRDPSGLYKFGRASVTKSELLKLKRFDDFEAEIVGIEEEMHNANEAKTNALGRTERSSAKAGKVGKGSLGKFICKGLTDFQGVEFGVGTGFSRAERQAFWAAGAGGRLNGQVIKVKYFATGVKDLPRFPTFLGFRDLDIDG